MTVSVSSALLNHSACLNNCKMKRSKQRTLFKFDVFAKTKKCEGTDTVVVSGSSGECVTR